MRYPIIDLGSFPIYNLMGCTGFILGLLLFMHNLKDYDLTHQKKDRLLFLFALSFLGAMAFANVGNWLVMPELWDKSVTERIAQAGLSYYFGLIGFVVLVSMLLKAFGYEVAKCINLFIPSLLLFHSLGRVGCSLAGCCYGKLVNWNIMDMFVLARFPAREIEALCLFILFLVAQLVIKENRLLFYLFTYPPIRFLLEYGRGDYRGMIFPGGLSIAQVISIVLFTSAVIYVMAAKRKSRQNHPMNRWME